MNPEKSCLLIDNDEDDREIFELALKQVCPSVALYTSHSGINALQMLRSDPAFVPSVIFIDLNMPLMDGRQSLEAIYKLEHLKGVPAYLYSTSADPRTVAAVKEMGATDFLIKPASFDALKELISKIIGAQSA